MKEKLKICSIFCLFFLSTTVFAGQPIEDMSVKTVFTNQTTKLVRVKEGLIYRRTFELVPGESYAYKAYLVGNLNLNVSYFDEDLQDYQKIHACPSMLLTDGKIVNIHENHAGRFFCELLS